MLIMRQGTGRLLDMKLRILFQLNEWSLKASRLQLEKRLGWSKSSFQSSLRKKKKTFTFSRTYPSEFWVEFLWCVHVWVRVCVCMGVCVCMAASVGVRVRLYVRVCVAKGQKCVVVVDLTQHFFFFLSNIAKKEVERVWKVNALLLLEDWDEL